MEKIPAASAMDWSIDLDRGLRSRHPGTRLRALEAVAPRLRQLGTSPTAPAAVASAFGVQTMLLRVATEFRSADNVVRARIVRSLLTVYRDLASKGRAYDSALGCGWRSPTRCSGGSRRCTTRGTRGPGRSGCGCSAALPTSPRTACTSALSCSPACAPPMLQRSKRHCLQLVAYVSCRRTFRASPLKY